MVESPVQPPPEQPDTTPAEEARDRMIGAGFQRVAVIPHRSPRGELWKNTHGKHVSIDFTDDFLSVFTETLETALNARNSKPAQPYASLWNALFGK